MYDWEKKEKKTTYVLQAKIPMELAIKIKAFVGKNYPELSIKSFTEKALREYLLKHDGEK